MGKAADSDPARTAPLLDAPGGQEESVDSARVLLIEDEPGIVDFVRRGLEAEGFAVEAALDGIEGERLALQRQLRRRRARSHAAAPRRPRGPRVRAPRDAERCR